MEGTAIAPVEVTVIVASYRAKATIGLTLEALAAQRTEVAWELIVVDSSDDGTAELVRRSHPAVNLVTAPERLYAGAARNRGVEASSGAVLAFTDADCLPAPDWVERVASAHRRREEPVIGGVVDVANPASLAGCGYYFAEFAAFGPGAAAGPVADIPACCLSIKRRAWERWGPFLEEGYCSDTVFHWRMRAAGARPFRDPSIRVAHLNPDRVGRNLAHGIEHGGHFARARCRELGLSRIEAAARALLAPALPPLLLARGFAATARNRTRLGRYVAALPCTLLQLSAWSYGELRGYLAHARGRS